MATEDFLPKWINITGPWSKHLLGIESARVIPYLPSREFVTADFSFLDRLDRYMVAWRAQGPSPADDQWQALAEQGTLVENTIAADGQQGWAIVRATSQEAIADVLEQAGIHREIIVNTALIKAGHQASQ